MTLQTLSTSLLWPGILSGITGQPAIASASTLDASGEYQAFIGVASQDMVISHIGMKLNSAVGTPTADIRVETVAADGTPSGTLWATNTNIVTGTLTTTFAVHALTASATITRGQTFCINIVYNSGTSLALSTMTGTNWNNDLPYRVTNTTGSAVKTAYAAKFGLALMSDATTPYPLKSFWPVISGPTSGAFNNTNGARKGLRFQVPFICRCVGIRILRSSDDGNYNIAMYNDAGTELSSSSTAFDGDHALDSALQPLDLYFDNTVTLSAATWYRAAIEPSSATNVGFFTMALPSAGYAVGMPGGANAYVTTYASSTWTDSGTDTIPTMDILIDQLDDGTGGGGGGGGHVIGG